MPHRLSKKTLRLLILEDSVADAELTIGELERGGVIVTAERVDAKDSFVRALRDFAPDVVISDHSLAQFDARAALKLARAIRPTAPVVIVSGAMDEQVVVTCIREGAEDWVSKDRLGRLIPALERALWVRRHLRKLTPRQLEVLRLVAEGHTTREVARRLRLSAKTVETHRGEVMKRLEIHDVVGLARYAVRVGLVNPD